MSKTKVLFIGESSFLSTGYAVYTHEILKRLYETSKYEIAEFGIYGYMNDARRIDIPWTFYANMPDTPEQEQVYHANQLNQFGQWKFDEICIDFNPDVVIDIRDWWMTSFAERSPFRDFFDWAIMPTIDSVPQPDEWMASYSNADAVFAYSEFGRDYLLESLGDSVNFVDLACPAANYDIMKPVADKAAHKARFGFHDGLKIVGTVMRNQRRKLYPDLIQAFSQYCEQNPETSKNVYLYLHTSHPDKGWDIPLLLREYGVGNKTLFTYLCDQPSCQHVFPSFFKDALQVCPKCGKPTAQLPSTHLGVTPEQMAQIMNFFDIYVQYSNCEGFGMPQVEAAACGIPVIAVDYSAMTSVMDNLGGFKIPVQRFIHEETTQKRALPDNDAFIQTLNRFMSLSEGERMRLSRKMYKNAKRHYTWDKAAKAWERYLDTIEPKPMEKTWKIPSRAVAPDINVPQGLNNEQFVRWGIINIWRRPEMMYSYMALRLIRDLNYRQSLKGGQGNSYFHSDNSLFGKPVWHKFSRDDAIKELLELNNIFNHWEERRIGLLKETPPPFIQEAKR
jgi:glycosyltransferase involved in cell wall biosynthesis